MTWNKYVQDTEHTVDLLIGSQNKLLETMKQTSQKHLKLIEHLKTQCSSLLQENNRLKQMIKGEKDV